ncbi:MAG: hypothetical protein AAF004_06055 [Pseudomonadota bacterium]
MSLLSDWLPASDEHGGQYFIPSLQGESRRVGRALTVQRECTNLDRSNNVEPLQCAYCLHY